MAARKGGRISFHAATSANVFWKPAAWFGWTNAVKIKLSATTQTAICDRTKTALASGPSPGTSRGSAEPRNAIAAAAGVGNNIAAESSSGKLKLNCIDTFVGTGSSSATATAAAQTYICHSVNG